MSLISNPRYTGKVTIPNFKDEKAYLVDGPHEPLISESTLIASRKYWIAENVVTKRRL
ncbi:recombinase family protein [Pedobacter gandavensis]|uniref:recombinase family protein n=1 Tax=Pedobacter gandavensis TaxID=2679963 RepID=UPI00292FF942|nr:recombinase family protein [Pedobacter gandavensis]